MKTTQLKKYESGKQPSGRENNISGDRAISPSSLLKNILRGLLVELLIGILFFFCAEYVVYRSPDPDSNAVAGALAALYLTAIAGGFAVTKINRHGAPVCGLINGVMLLAVLFCISFFAEPFPYETFSGGIKAVLHVLIIPASLAGAFLAVKRKNGRNSKPRRDSGRAVKRR